MLEKPALSGQHYIDDSDRFPSPPLNRVGRSSTYPTTISYCDPGLLAASRSPGSLYPKATLIANLCSERLLRFTVKRIFYGSSAPIVGRYAPPGEAKAWARVRALGSPLHEKVAPGARPSHLPSGGLPEAVMQSGCNLRLPGCLLA